MNAEPYRPTPPGLSTRAAQTPLCAAALWARVAPGVQAQNQPQAERGPVTVRYSEGTVHGFLELRTDEDRLLAHGDLLQVPGDSAIESRMIFHFSDTSYFEETTIFTQHRVFRMETYHLVQRGPAFRADLDAALSRDGRFVVTSTSHNDGKVERYTGRLDLPSDVYNGLPVVVAKNLRMGDTVNIHLVAFMPKPRLIGLRVAFAGTDTVLLGTHAEPAAHFVLTPQLGAFTTFFAKLLGKLPPDSNVWIVMDQVPAFVRFEGPMYLGPVWRLTMATPTWPAVPKSQPK